MRRAFFGLRLQPLMMLMPENRWGIWPQPRPATAKKRVSSGVMTRLGGLGQALPDLILDFWTATAISIAVVFPQLWVIAYIQNRFVKTPFFRDIPQIVISGVLVLVQGFCPAPVKGAFAYWSRAKAHDNAHSMLDILFQTVPFFAIIALGWGAGKIGFFTPEATAYLTKFVFYFALSAMLFRFSANLSFQELYAPAALGAYLWATMVVYLLVTAVALIRRLNIQEAAVEAQCGVIGNVGFLGLPMLVMLMGEAAVVPVMLVLVVDLLVFGSLIVILITGSRDGRVGFGILQTVGLGLLKNPMIVSICLGLAWSALAVPIPAPLNAFLDLLGAAATPGALFAIGASLASKSAERIEVAGWLSFCKLVLHPLAVAVSVLVLLPVDRYIAGVMIAAAALPTAGNVYILAAHYGVAPARVSATILVSTVISIVTLSTVIAWVGI